MTSQIGTKTIGIHILPNISRGKGYQTMKLGQLTEYNMWKTFLDKSYKNVVEKPFPNRFLKNQIKNTTSFDENS